MKMKISIIVPLFNEEESIPIFYSRIRKELSSSLKTSNEREMIFELVFVNDGSNDGTEKIINNLKKSG